MPTTILPNGKVVAAKVYKGFISALTYSNLTQAEIKLKECGEGWEIQRGRYGFPFFIVNIKKREKE